MKSLSAPLAALALAAGLGACTSMSMRAPSPTGFTGPTGPVQPTGAAVMVERNDTLSIIARRHGVTLEALGQVNNIPPPYRLHVGQILVLPVGNMAQYVAPPALTPAPDRTVIRAAPVPQPGGRVEPLARGAPIVATPAPSANAFGRSNDVQSEALTPVAPPPPSVPSRPAPAPAFVPAPAPAPAPVPQRVEPRVAAAPPPAAPAAPSDEAAPARVPSRTARSFGWPVQGTIASDFGSKPGGLANDGINIAAAAGTPVRAAENGVVNYAGNELRGFGNLVLIRHADGYVTAYAHLEAIDVQTGAQVRRGQVIGRVGQTGNVSTPQLHFEIRRAGKVVNPHQVLASAER